MYQGRLFPAKFVLSSPGTYDRTQQMQRRQQLTCTSQCLRLLSWAGDEAAARGTALAWGDVPSHRGWDTGPGSAGAQVTALTQLLQRVNQAHLSG